jgi:hypothetical protein
VAFWDPLQLRKAIRPRSINLRRGLSMRVSLPY